MKQFIALIIIAIFQLSCEENSKPNSKDNIKLNLTESCTCFDGIGSSKNDERFRIEAENPTIHNQ